MKRIILMLCSLMLIVQPINLSAEEAQPDLNLKGKTNRIAAVPNENASILTKKGVDISEIETKVILNDQFVAPIDQGDSVGSLELYLDNQLINSIDLIANGYNSYTDATIDRDGSNCSCINW